MNDTLAGAPLPATQAAALSFLVIRLYGELLSVVDKRLCSNYKWRDDDTLLNVMGVAFSRRAVSVAWRRRFCILDSAVSAMEPFSIQKSQ